MTHGARGMVACCKWRHGMMLKAMIVELTNINKPKANNGYDFRQN